MYGLSRLLKKLLSHGVSVALSPKVRVSFSMSAKSPRRKLTRPPAP
jgi:hypothetical protein